MTGCSAPNCSNHSRNGFKFHRFPADPDRRKKWLVNCRRQDWNPTRNDRLCSAHFEDSQLEQNRSDGKKRLLPFAVPTIFNVSNAPKLLDISRKSVYKRSRNKSEQNNLSTENPSKRIKLDVPYSFLSMTESQKIEYGDKDTAALISELQNKVAHLEGQLKHRSDELAEFLTPGQTEHLAIERKFIKHWNSEDIIKSLKLRFALGKNGYNYLRETGYPAPSYSTLNKRISSVTVDFGVLKAFVDLLPKKVEGMTEIEKHCSVMVDEMEISGDVDFDKSKKALLGQVTLGDKSKRGTHLTVVALRGLSTPWKQIIACHVTGLQHLTC